MELPWPIKLRIAAVVAAGVILIGILAWPMAAPAEPLGIVSAASITFKNKLILIALAFLTGLLAYFLSQPYGREIGILAVPSGLAIWAVRSGTVADLMQTNPSLAHRLAILAALKWEPLFWLIVIAAGFIGVLLGQKISPPKTTPDETQKKNISNATAYLNAAIALVGSILITQLCLRILAQDVRMSDGRLGSVVAQPHTGQIVFAVLVSFGLSGFLFKKFLGVNYIWPALASGFVTAFTHISYVRENILQYLADHWPAAFFPNAILAILPVQMVAFGTLGSIVGYWLAVRYDYWKEHEME